MLYSALKRDIFVAGKLCAIFKNITHSGQLGHYYTAVVESYKGYKREILHKYILICISKTFVIG